MTVLYTKIKKVKSGFTENPGITTLLPIEYIILGSLVRLE